MQVIARYQNSSDKKRRGEDPIEGRKGTIKKEAKSRIEKIRERGGNEQNNKVNYRGEGRREI